MASNDPQFLRAEEYEKIFLDGKVVNKDDPLLKNIHEDLFKVYEKSIPQKEEEIFKTLGFNPDRDGFKAHWFVGQVWIIPEKIVLTVLPKTDNNKNNVNYFQMFLECLKHPVVSGHMDDCFKFWPDQSLIPNNSEKDICPLIIAAFLKSLFLLCQRHLKRNFIRIQENLTGRFKGRLLLNQHIRQNLTRARPDRIFCQYQVHSHDTLENQILKTALEQCSRYLGHYKIKDGALHSWVTYCRGMLGQVSLRRINPVDFKNIRYSGFLKPYKNPHNLAKMIFKAIGSDPGGEFKQKIEFKLPPFALDMNELFERYTEVKLRQEGYDLRCGYKDKNLGKVFKVRPDFLGKSKTWIMDAKYKYLYEKGNPDKDFMRNDIYQVLAYSRFKSVLKELCLNEDSGKPEKIIILYPKPNSNHKEKLDLTNLDKDLLSGESQIPVYKVPVPLPIKPPSN